MEWYEQHYSKREDYQEFGLGKPPRRGRHVKSDLWQSLSTQELYQKGFYQGIRGKLYKKPVAFCNHYKRFLDASDMYWHRCKHLWNSKNPQEHVCKSLMTMEQFKENADHIWDTPDIEIDEEL